MNIFKRLISNSNRERNKLLLFCCSEFGCAFFQIWELWGGNEIVKCFKTFLFSFHLKKLFYRCLCFSKWLRKWVEGRRGGGRWTRVRWCWGCWATWRRSKKRDKKKERCEKSVWQKSTVIKRSLLFFCKGKFWPLLISKSFRKLEKNLNTVFFNLLGFMAPFKNRNFLPA